MEDKIYYMSGAETRSSACAKSPEGTTDIWRMAKLLECTGELPFKLSLKNITFEKSGIIYNDDISKLRTIWSDCLLNCELLFLCSQQLQTVIDVNLKGTEGVKWISCKVIGMGEEREYYFPLFTRKLDIILNEQKPYFDYNKTKNYAMFSYYRSFNWQVPESFYVSSDMKKAITRAGFSNGIYFNIAGAPF